MPVSMSRHYGRGYHRRGTPVCQTSFPIDKLFKENSNRPSAARSAGTIGKWGITSFTTIRGSSYDSSIPKYSSFKRQNQNINSGDSFAFDGADIKPKVEGPPKPKKFFKSRNVEPSDEKAASTPAVSGNKIDAKAGGKKKDDFGTTSKKTYGSKQSPKNDQSQSGNEYKPPIVLRIFKGTSCIIADSDKASSPTTTSPVSPKTRSSPKPEKPPVTRSTRRKSCQETAEVAPVSPRPKRTRKEVIKDPAIQSIISQLISDDEDEAAFDTEPLASSEPLQTSQPEQVDDASDDSIPLASTSFYSKKEETSNKENEDNANALQQIEDTQKLEEANELLKETNLDFAQVVDNMLNPPAKEEPVCEKPTGEVEAEPVQEPPADERDFESESDSSDAVNPVGVTLTSKVESGGLKLVIKKTPESNTEKEPVAETEDKEEETVPAKVMPVKKKSIFKSRVKDETGNAKRLALYKHNWNSSQALEPNNKPTAPTSASQYDDINEFELGGLTRVPTDPADPTKPVEDVTKVKCDKKDKGVII